MEKTGSSYVPPQSSESVPDGSATRSFPGGGVDASAQTPAEISSDELTTGPEQVLPAEQQRTVISKPHPSGDSSFGALPSPFELGRALEGQRLEHFELEKFVGGGGMGAVFRARDTQLGRIVAVKVLSRDQAADDETVRRFKNEAQSAARLDHDNIARVYYVGEDSGWNFIVFEFIDGINLRDMVQQSGPLPLGQAVSFMLQVAEALSHASRRDVVHRDIKPSNVLIMAPGKAKLVDMGLARLHQVESTQADLTASGVTLGTFDYISPEQARDPRSADVRSELYSLGCTFFFTLTGRPPFPEGTVLQKLLSHSSEAPPDPRQYRPELPEEVTRILSKMLSKHPEDRYQEASELIGELLLMSEKLGLPVAERGAAVWITPGQVQISPWEQHLPWAVPVVVLVLVVLLMNYSSSSPRWDKSPPRRHRRTIEQTSVLRDVDRTDSAPTGTEAGDATAAMPATESPREGVERGEPGPGDRHVDQAEPEGVNGSQRVPPDNGHETAADPPDDSSSGAADDSPNNGERDSPEPPDPDADINRSGGTPDAMAAVTPGDSRPENDNEPSPESDPVIVGEGGENSLEKALLRAELDSRVDTIELRFNGRMTVKSFTLFDRSLHIRAGQDYAPILVLEPGLVDPFEQRSSMITLIRGELTLVGVHLEFDVPDEPFDHWTLFRLQDVELFWLIRCSMTIRNDRGKRGARHSNVAFFRLGPAWTSDRAPPASALQPGFSAIDMLDCEARGEAFLVQTHASVPMRLRWTNGLLITTERLLEVAGAEHPPSEGRYITLELDHVTAIVDNGLVRMVATEQASCQRMVDVKCSNSIMVTHPFSPLVEHIGPGDLEAISEPFVFRGTGNFYPDGSVKVFRHLQSITDFEARRQDRFAAWEAMWPNEELPRRVVRWVELPSPERPVNELTATDYALSNHASNDAWEAAGKGNNAGHNAKMPLLPAITDIVPQPDALFGPEPQP